MSNDVYVVGTDMIKFGRFPERTDRPPPRTKRTPVSPNEANARRAADLSGAAANDNLLAEPVAAYADTEPVLPNKKE